MSQSSSSTIAEIGRYSSDPGNVNNYKPDTFRPRTVETASGQYTTRIKHHAELSSCCSLHSGENYRSLARLLTNADSISNTQRQPSRRSSFDHVCVYFLKQGSSAILFKYDAYCDHGVFRQELASDGQVPRLIFIRGRPSPDWIETLGSACTIDPGFFRDHMNFLERKNYFDLPSLPSQSNTAIKFRLTTICKRKEAIGRDTLQHSRDMEAENLRAHQRQTRPADLVGDSIVRKFSIHNESLFSIEQDISCCVKYLGEKGYIGGYHVCLFTQFFLRGSINDTD